MQQIIKTVQSSQFHGRIVDECFCIARNRETAKIWFFGQTRKQLLNEPWKSWKNNNFEDRNLALFAYKKNYFAREQHIKTFESCHFHDRIVDGCFCISEKSPNSKNFFIWSNY